ncbi:MAG: hypothetical protein ABIF18_01275 [archaeon]
MKKFEKSLIIGGFDPFHEGHEFLLKTSRDYSDSTDVYIGAKKRKNRLPRHIRAKSVESVIKYNNWENQIRIIGTGKYVDLNPAKYSLFIAGSDFLNFLSLNISSRGKEIKDSYKNYYLSFPNILIVNRKGMPLKPEVRSRLSEHVNILDLQGHIDISGTQIRKAYKDGKDIRKMVSGNVWKVIEDYVHVFNN